MSSHFTVVYDACVLYPAPLRDLLEAQHPDDFIFNLFDLYPAAVAEESVPGRR